MLDYENKSMRNSLVGCVTAKNFILVKGKAEEIVVCQSLITTSRRFYGVQI